MLSVTRHVLASSNQRRTGMKIQNSWKAAASGPQFIAAHASCDGFFKIFCVELKSSEILIIIDFTISQLPNMSFFLCPTKKQFLLQVHLGPEVWGAEHMTNMRSASMYFKQRILPRCILNMMTAILNILCWFKSG